MESYRTIKCEKKLICSCGGKCRSVCSKYPRMEMKGRFLIREERSDSQLFLALSSPDEYLKLDKKADVCYHEIIFESWPRKIHLDIDNGKEVMDGDALPAYMHLIEGPLSRLVADVFYDMYRDQFIIDSLAPPSVVITFSVNDKACKPGVHLIIRDYAIPNVHDLAIFMKCLKHRLSGEMLSLKLDEGVINEGIQNFRLVGSHKLNDDRFKIVYSGGTDADTILTRNFKHIMRPSFFNTSHIKVVGNIISTITLEAKDADAKCRACMSEDEQKSFEMRDVIGNLVNYNRIAPCMCSICRRVHEKDNTLFFIVLPTMVLKKCRHALT